MKQLIINEYEYVESLLSSTTLPSDVSVTQLLVYLSKYYISEVANKSEFKDKVLNKVKEFNLSPIVYQEYKAAKQIEKYYNGLVEGKMDPLRDFDTIPVYQKEIESINACDSDRQKKLLFTLYVLARFTNKYGWVYQTRSDLFKLANISTTGKNQPNVVHELLEKGLIKLPIKVDDNKIGVNYSDDDLGPVVLEVSSLKNIGNQYIAFSTPNKKLCEKCGKLITIKSKNDYSSKYCSQCADMMTRESWRNASLKYRNAISS